MTATTLLASDNGPIDVAALTEALGHAFSVRAGGRKSVRRARLDTFDRRLAAAGMRLERQVVGRSGRLVLHCGGAAGSSRELTVEDGGLRLPALVGALPEGPLRDAVAPEMDIRALMALSDEPRYLRHVELRNEDSKLVGRLEVDEPTTPGGGPATMTLRALRGYDKEAGRALRLLTPLGLRHAHPEEPAAPDSSSAPEPKLTPKTSGDKFLATVLTGFLSTMQTNLPGLLDDIDTEFLHDFRVAVRRTRSTLKLGRPALPAEWRDAWEPAFKWLGDLTTPVRDLDVYQLDLPTMASWLVAADPSDLEQLEQHLQQRRSRERRALLRGLRSERYERLVLDWASALDDLGQGDQAVAPEGPERLAAGDLAARAIAKAGRRVLRDGSAVHADSPAEDLHNLRKRCKELRYALEVFAPVIDKSARKALVSDLKALQDVLGRFQDTEVQRHAMRGFAQEMMVDGTPTEAVLAMGELIGHLDTAQDEARSQFDDAFARMSRPANRSRLAGLSDRR